MKKKCIVCKKEFEGSARSKYCSTRCSHRRLNGRAKDMGKFSKSECACKVCNKKFTKRTRLHKFCSVGCGNKYHKELREKQPKTEYYKLRFEIMKRDDFTCQYCGRNVIEDKIKIHIDHIYPKTKGGADNNKNLVVSCEECNLGKSDVLLEEHQMKKLVESIKKRQEVRL